MKNIKANRNSSNKIFDELIRQFLHKKQCVTRKFHVLVVQNGIVVEKTSFGKKIGCQNSVALATSMLMHMSKRRLNVSRQVLGKVFVLGGHSLNCFEVIQFFSSWGEG